MLIRRENLEYYIKNVADAKERVLYNFKKFRKTEDTYFFRRAKAHLSDYKQSLATLNRLKSIDYEWYENKIVELFELYFPGKYDVQDDIVLLHFPEVLITNTNGKVHTGTDYYFRFKFYGIRDNDIELDVIRMSATPEEIFSEYCHSHIGSHSLKDWRDSICFGNDFEWRGLPMLIGLELLLSNLQGFIETESTLTNPYRFISKIGSYSTEIKDDHEYEIGDITKIEFDLTTEIVKDYVYVSPVDNERLDMYLINTYDDALCYYNNGKYYEKYATENNVKIENTQKFMFKGEEISFKILPSKKIVPERVLNIIFKQQFLKHSKYEITKKLVALATPDPKPVIDNKRKPVQKNPIPVLQD